MIVDVAPFRVMVQLLDGMSSGLHKPERIAERWLAMKVRAISMV